jgi:hypothetical protein
MTFAPFEMVNPLPKDRITFKYSGSTNGNGWSTEGPSPYTMTGEMIATFTKEWTSKTNYMIVSVITPRVEAVALYSPVYGKYDPA